MPKIQILGLSVSTFQNFILIFYLLTIYFYLLYLFIFFIYIYLFSFIYLLFSFFPEFFNNIIITSCFDCCYFRIFLLLTLDICMSSRWLGPVQCILIGLLLTWYVFHALKWCLLIQNSLKACVWHKEDIWVWFLVPLAVYRVQVQGYL